jgi:hypothetical protein
LKAPAELSAFRASVAAFDVADSVPAGRGADRAPVRSRERTGQEKREVGSSTLPRPTAAQILALLRDPSLGGALLATASPQERLDVTQVLVTPGGPLVLNERVDAKDWYPHALDLRFCSRRPRIVEGESGYARENVDSIWRQTELRDRIGLREIRFLDSKVFKRHSELRQRRPHASRIVGSGVDPDVDVDRCPGDSVNSERVGPDDQKT